MDTQQENLPEQEENISTQNVPVEDKKSNKLVKIGAGFAVICVVAGATYGALAFVAPKKGVSQTKQVTTKVETAATIDSSIQSDINDEQKADDDIANQESQSIQDEVNTSETLEGNYEGY